MGPAGLVAWLRPWLGMGVGSERGSLPHRYAGGSVTGWLLKASIFAGNSNHLGRS